jgi:hypothetical protein
MSISLFKPIGRYKDIKWRVSWAFFYSVFYKMAGLRIPITSEIPTNAR